MRSPIAIALALSLAVCVGATNLALTDRDINRALTLARASEDQRARFHRAYIVPVDDANLSAAMPSRCSSVTNRFGSG